eukprot:m.185335 g.185335  ORF g.185335 m.185335 type:complete len:519 (-) comp10517_c0_seq2:881-2437(-)
MRVAPVGWDRDERQYFVFQSLPGLFVQVCGEGPEEWHVFQTPEEVDALVALLNPRGIRENQLKGNIQELQSSLFLRARDTSYIKSVGEPAEPAAAAVETDFARQLSELRTSIEEFYTEVCSVGFGCTASDAWIESLRTKARLDELAACLVQVQQQLELRFLRPPLGHDIKNDAAAAKRALEGVDTAQLAKWRDAATKCTTLAQVRLLLELLHESVRWEKSAKNIKCHVCRKNGETMPMAICDKCDRGFHCRCLKPRLEEPPSGAWQCPSCIPRVGARRARRQVDASDESEQESSDDDDEEEEDEEGNDASGEACGVCGEDGDFLACGACPRVFHPECCGLRRAPRGVWKCPKCKKAAEKEHLRHTKAARRKAKQFLEQTSSKTLSSSRGNQKDHDLEKCVEIWKELNRHPDAWPFLQPVSLKEVPDYLEHVTTPMDLQTVRDKLDTAQYDDVGQFSEDVRLIFRNCEKYNDAESEAGQAGKNLSDFFEDMYVAYFVANVAQPSGRSRRQRKTYNYDSS